MHITLLTATGAYNLGDELILRTEYEYLCARYPDATFTVCTYDSKSSLIEKNSSVRYISYFPNALKHRPITNIVFLLQNIWHIARSDFVVMGGGGLIYDNEAGQSFRKLLLEWKIRVLIARLFQTPIVYWSLGIHVSRKNQDSIASLFQGSQTRTSVRDVESHATLERLGIDSTIVPDPVLLYDPEIPKLAPKRRPRVGLALRSGYLPNELDTIERMIVALQARDYEIVVLNHSLHPTDTHSNDAGFLSPLVSKYHLTSTRTIQETLDAYKWLEFVVAMRLHSIILSVVHAIPFLAVSYSTKTDEFLRDIGYEYTLSARTFDIDIFKKRIERIEQDKKALQFALTEKNDMIKGEIENTLKSLFDGLEKTLLGRTSLGK